MTGGSPSNGTRTVMMYIIESAFRYFKLGKASAMSIVVMMMLIVLTLIQKFILVVLTVLIGLFQTFHLPKNLLNHKKLTIYCFPMMLNVLRSMGYQKNNWNT